MLQFVLAGLSLSRDSTREIERTLSGYLIFGRVPSGTLTYMPIFTKNTITEHPNSSWTTLVHLHNGFLYVQYIHLCICIYNSERLRLSCRPSEGLTPTTMLLSCLNLCWLVWHYTWWELIIKSINRSHHDKDQNMWLPSARLNKCPRSTK